MLPYFPPFLWSQRVRIANIEFLWIVSSIAKGCIFIWEKWFLFLTLPFFCLLISAHVWYVRLVVCILGQMLITVCCQPSVHASLSQTTHQQHPLFQLESGRIEVGNTKLPVTHTTFRGTVHRYLILVLRIRDPVPFWPRNPEWVKNQDPDPGWTTQIIFPRD